MNVSNLMLINRVDHFAAVSSSSDNEEIKPKEGYLTLNFYPQSYFLSLIILYFLPRRQ